MSVLEMIGDVVDESIDLPPSISQPVLAHSWHKGAGATQPCGVNVVDMSRR
jgi:hypothetical protein